MPPCLTCLMPSLPCSALGVRGGSRSLLEALTWLQGQQFLHIRLSGVGGAGAALIRLSPGGCSPRKGLAGAPGCERGCSGWSTS